MCCCSYKSCREYALNIMGYFVIIIFSTFLGSPPEFLPVAFKKHADCQDYLISKVVKKYQYMKVIEDKNTIYLTNYDSSKFIICEKLEYPVIRTGTQANKH